VHERPEQTGELVTLPDGACVRIRPITAEDKGLLQRGLEKLSRESRYRRFLSPKGRLTERELTHLTEVDHHDHEALIATTPDGAEPIGVARYIRLDEDPGAAEVAVAVVDAWHRRGVGTALVERLTSRATSAGIERFRAIFFSWNREVRELLKHLGVAHIEHSEPGFAEMEIDLANPRALRGALRGAAAEELHVRPRRQR
jgi:RimJ/RimL family protein N-acetyltransferase